MHRPWSMKCALAIAIGGLLAILSLQAYGRVGNRVAKRYIIIELPLRPAHLNNSGQVGGTTAKHKAAVWTKQEGLREIAMPSEFATAEGMSLNSSGHLAGVANNGSQHHAFVYKNGQFVLLPGNQSIVGDVYDEHARYHAFLWTKNHGIQRIDQSRSFSSAIAINDAGHVLVLAVSEGLFLYLEGTLSPVELSSKFPSSPQPSTIDSMTMSAP